jgi:uncharacterized cupredoxin-like copper-binding protein
MDHMLRAAIFSPFIFAIFPMAGHAGHFAMELKVQSVGASATAKTETAGLGAKANPRVVLHIKSGERITVRWVLTYQDAKNPAKNVLVHFFAAREDAVGQKTMPKLDKNVAAESALTMDFNPKDKARGELTFTIQEAGAYLVRVETIGAAAGTNEHEHFAALDLMVTK